MDWYELEDELNSIREEIELSIMSGEDEDIPLLHRQEQFLIGQMNAYRNGNEFPSSEKNWDD